MRGSAEQLARENRKRAQRLKREFQKSAKKTEGALYNTALWKFSVGSVSLAEMSNAPPGLNHPYGIGMANSRGPRGPVPYGNPGIINKQSGDFAANWDTASKVSVKSVTVTLWNASAHAQYLLGTSKMIPRPILDLIAKTEYPQFVLEFSAAWRRAMQP